jgi:(1->4)-alpha-D-glucan 1-alpha-D-glucosylmutase
VLADALNRLSEADRRSRDFTHHSLRDVLMEVVACFPVYRTYVSGRGWSDADVRAIDSALHEAQRRNRPLGRSIFEFLRCVMLPAGLPGLDAGDNRFEPRPDFAERLRFSMAMQQFTAPVQAKGLEDTAFYRHNALISLNEVGGEPARFGRSPVEFHASNAARLAEWPYGMLATSTHDTKLGEDTRLRVHAISELTDEWRGLVTRWQRLTAGARRRLEDGWAPEGNDVYRFYQALVGAWPAGQRDNTTAMEQLSVRLRAYMTKALRESKARTSWVHRNEPYEAAVDAFVNRVLTGRSSRKFLDAVEPFAERIAELGARYALSQLVLKLSSPGVPDFYQGSELWTLTLVDPDNRAPVDFEARAAALEALAPLLEGVEQPDARAQMAALDSRVSDLRRSWRDGRIKLYVTAAGLRLRRADRDLFLRGDYVPLDVEPSSQASVVALARRFEDRMLIALVPRLAASICPPGAGLAASCAWGDTRVWIPDALCPRDLFDVFTGRRASLTARQDGRVAISVMPVLDAFPVAWLWGRTTETKDESS